MLVKRRLVCRPAATDCSVNMESIRGTQRGAGTGPDRASLRLDRAGPPL